MVCSLILLYLTINTYNIYQNNFDINLISKDQFFFDNIQILISIYNTRESYLYYRKYTIFHRIYANTI